MRSASKSLSTKPLQTVNAKPLEGDLMITIPRIQLAFHSDLFDGEVATIYSNVQVSEDELVGAKFHSLALGKTFTIDRYELDRGFLTIFVSRRNWHFKTVTERFNQNELDGCILHKNEREK